MRPTPSSSRPPTACIGHATQGNTCPSRGHSVPWTLLAATSTAQRELWESCPTSPQLLSVTHALSVITATPKGSVRALHAPPERACQPSARAVGTAASPVALVDSATSPAKQHAAHALRAPLQRTTRLRPALPAQMVASALTLAHQAASSFSLALQARTMRQWAQRAMHPAWRALPARPAPCPAASVQAHAVLVCLVHTQIRRALVSARSALRDSSRTSTARRHALLVRSASTARSAPPSQHPALAVPSPMFSAQPARPPAQQ